MFEDLTSFCPFIGYTRSGHSLIGATLDAHESVVIPHEMELYEKVDADTVTMRPLRVPQRFYTERLDERDSFLAALVRRAELQAAKGRSGYRVDAQKNRQQVSYAVEGQHQGSATVLKVIGNKRGQEFHEALSRDPKAIEMLTDFLRLPLKFVHVIRNPFDNIGAWTTFKGERAPFIYFRQVETVRQVKEAGWSVLDVHLEDFIADPGEQLARICTYLDLTASPDYLAACADIVMKEPSLSRTRRDWTKKDIRFVRRRMGEFPWLERYVDTELASLTA